MAIVGIWVVGLSSTSGAGVLRASYARWGVTSRFLD